ncbi:MAG: hypothetical protein ACR2LR_26000 [Hassallia sp.]
MKWYITAAKVRSLWRQLFYFPRLRRLISHRYIGAQANMRHKE